jgi:hypothetical protein
MALTEDQKSAVRAYLGWSDQFADLDTRLESQLANLRASAETRVTALLTKIAAIDDAIQSKALTRLDASEIVGEVKLLGPEQLRTLRVQGRMLCGQLGQVFFVEPKRDYFDEGGGAMGGLIQLG